MKAFRLHVTISAQYHKIVNGSFFSQTRRKKNNKEKMINE